MGRKRIISGLSFVLVILMIAAFAYLPMRILHNASHDASRVSHTHEVRKEIQDITDALRSIEYQHRSFIFTGQPHYRSERDKEIKRLRLEIEGVYNVIGDSRDQLQRLDDLTQKVDLDLLPALYQDDLTVLPLYFQNQAQAIPNHEAVLDDLFSAVRRMDNEEEVQLLARREKLAQTVRNDSLISILMGVAAGVLLLCLYLLYRADTQEKERTASTLKMANAEVQKANQMKSAFVANMSHEIRTPLGAILGFADLLASDEITEEERDHFVEVIRRNGRALSQIIDDVLDLSKVEAGKITIEKVEFDLIDLLEDIVHLLQHKADQKGIELKVESDPGFTTRFLSDPNRIRQILINILGNALKFTDEGQIHLHCSFVAAPESVQDGQLIFTIADTGVGISPEQQLRLFQPYEQAEVSTSRYYGGTGLGLSLSRRLAELLGGSVTLENSAIGQGSRFRVNIPVKALFIEHHLTDDQSVIPIDEELLTPEIRFNLLSNEILKNVRILLAEDAPDNQLLISQILAGSGADVVVVDNGRDAVARALQGDQDLILMDIQMPVLGGYEAALELRSKGYRGPIVALSAHAMLEDRKKSEHSGCDDYLTKPIDTEKLISTIRHFTQDVSLA